MCFNHISLITSFVGTACPTKSNECNRIITNTELLSSVPACSNGNIAFLSASKFIRARSYLWVCDADRLWANRCTEGWWTAEHPNSAAQNQWRPWQRWCKQCSAIKPALSYWVLQKLRPLPGAEVSRAVNLLFTSKRLFWTVLGTPCTSTNTAKRNQIQNGTWGSQL